MTIFNNTFKLMDLTLAVMKPTTELPTSTSHQLHWLYIQYEASYAVTVVVAVVVVEGIVCAAFVVSSDHRAPGWACFRFEDDQNCC